MTNHFSSDEFKWRINIRSSLAREKEEKRQTWNDESVFPFLITGPSRPPIEVFKIAGVDMTSTQPMEDAFEVLEKIIGRLESLTK